MKKNLSAYCSFYGGKTTVVYLLIVLSVIALVSISLSPTSALGQERSRGATEKAEIKKTTAEKQSINTQSELLLALAPSASPIMGAPPMAGAPLAVARPHRQSL